MRIIPFLLLSLAFSFTLSANSNHSNDQDPTFEQLINLQNPTDNQIEKILNLSHKYRDINGDSCLLLAKKALIFTQLSSKGKLHASALLASAYAYRITGDASKSEAAALEVLQHSSNNGDQKSLAQANALLGTISRNNGAYESALDYFIQAAKTWETLNLPIKQAETYSSIYGIFFNLNELGKSQKYISKIKQIAEKLNNDDLRIDAGGLQALNWMTHGIHYYIAHQKDTSTTATHLDTLNHYFNLSEREYDQTLEIARKSKNKQMIITLLNNIVPLALNMEQYDKALKAVTEADILASELGVVPLIIQSKNNKSSIYRRQGEYEKAAFYGEESLALSTKNGLERKAFLANRTLYELYKTTANFKKANQSLEAMRAYDLKIGSTERNKAIAEVETKYETAKKEIKILELKSAKIKMEKQRNLLLGSGSLFGLLGFLLFRNHKIKKDRNDKIEFAEALIFAQEEERKRIARDLHDGVGQSLLLIKKQMESTHSTTLENQNMITDTLEEVRTISRDLHPFQLEKFGFTSAIEDVILKVERSTDLFISKEIDNIDSLLNPNAEINIYRTLQEAINNVVKHAQATAMKISILKKGAKLFFIINDNGIGYDYELTLVKTKSLGLKTMYERVQSLGGQFKVKKGIPKGTHLEFSIPQNTSK